MDMKEAKYKYLGREETYGESQKCLQLIKKFNEFTKKVYGIEFSIFGYDEILGYSNDFGYYVLIDGDNGRTEPIVYNYGLDFQEAFFKIINSFLFNSSSYFEIDNREKLSVDFEQRFNNFEFKISDKDIDSFEFYGSYIPSFYSTEYCLNKWNKYYDGNIPQEIIKFYEDYINNDPRNEKYCISWKYNLETKRFDCIKREKVRKLERM